jgi:hypothetical protein
MIPFLEVTAMTICPVAAGMTFWTVALAMT